jgi:small subunit ribosomal protein S23
MGRYDFRPQRVHQTATQLLKSERIANPPPWYNVVGSITPAQTLVRTQPIPHQWRKNGPKTRKASKLFQPQNICYEEDMLRKDFFKDHPWELARPRMIIEDDGKDSEKTDWSRTAQKEKALTGERLVLLSLIPDPN